MSAPLKELDWRELPLQGRALIEASAGTGKTYNIALLHLRLVLQQGLSVREILVCTFTEAAASELVERLRARLLQAQQLLIRLSTGNPLAGDDPLELWLSELSQQLPATELLWRARLALADLDLAPISTIHGYCKRLLNDYPFDSASSFRPGEVAEQSALIAECVEDWWRHRYQRDAVSLVENLLVLPLGPRGLSRRVEDLWRVRHSELIPPPTEQLQSALESLYSPDKLAELQQLIGRTELYSRSNARLRGILERFHAALCGEGDQRQAWSDLSLIDDEFIATYSHSSRPRALLQHPYLCWLREQLPLLLRRQSIALNGAALLALRFVEIQLPKRLAERDQISFDAMIERVHQGLSGETGAELAERIYAATPAALIDEFQDTDLQQWAIFDRIYRQDEGGPERGTLLLIGDPKQSIYAFRGADVHAYLAAREQVAERRSISTNYRSSAALIGALNGLYGAAGVAAFNRDQISYQAVSPGGDAQLPPLRVGESVLSQPLQIRRLADPGRSMEQREWAALSNCANEICALLSADWRLGGRALRPGDIAVLVNNNRQLQRIRELLQARGVPVVGSGRSDVFSTSWAADIQVLLHALLHPGRERALRAALATPLLGWRAVDLLNLEHDAALWEAQLERFGQWSARWRELGVLALLQPIIAEAAPRLLASAEGERALTDLRHLAELLESAATRCYGPEALLAWLVNARAGGSGGGDEAMREHQLRIESDAARVQLSTVHGSKGLEYNCVFLPVAWRALGRYDPSFARFHDRQHRLLIDLGGDQFEDHLDQHLDEDLCERMRRLYVGLTRARHACFVYTHQDLGRAGPATWQLSELGVLLGAALANTGADQDPDRWRRLAEQIPQLAVVDGDAAPARYQDQNAPLPPLSARGPMPGARPYRGLYSFSALTRAALQPGADAAQPGAEDEFAADTLPALTLPAAAPDHGQLALRLPDPRLEALAHWRGPAFGDAVHQIFELRQHGLPLRDQRELIHSQLRSQGVIGSQTADAAQIDSGVSAVAEMIQRTLDTPLSKGLRLGELQPQQLRAEMEFCFAVDDASLGAINRALARHQQPPLPPRGSDRLRGLMTGFIDLVFQWRGQFHLLDYKSNDLGTYPEDYTPAALDRAMDAHHYRLQALIYAVALQRYLRQRLPDYSAQRHLGSSWYLFVRGIGLAEQSGVWQRPIPTALIDDLDQLFAGAAEVA